MKTIYNLLAMGVQQITKAVNNSWDYINGNYAEKQEIRENNRNFDAVAKDYQDLYGNLEESVDDTVNNFANSCNSLPSC